MKKIILAIMLALTVGCKTQIDYKSNDLYEYYVIDPSLDIPDAYFETLNEAQNYKKQFAANHDYVIVKFDKYQVYNVAPDN
jgi:hypothetical protein